MHPMLLHERYLTELAMTDLGDGPHTDGEVQRAVAQVCNRFPSLAHRVAVQLDLLRTAVKNVKKQSFLERIIACALNKARALDAFGVHRREQRRRDPERTNVTATLFSREAASLTVVSCGGEVARAEETAKH